MINIQGDELAKQIGELAKTTGAIIAANKEKHSELAPIKEELLRKITEAIAPHLASLLITFKAPTKPIDRVLNGGGLMIGTRLEGRSTAHLFLTLSEDGTRPVYLQRQPRPMWQNAGKDTELTITEVIEAGWWPSSIIAELAKQIGDRLAAARVSKAALSDLADRLKMTLRVLWPQEKNQ